MATSSSAAAGAGAGGATPPPPPATFVRATAGLWVPAPERQRWTAPVHTSIPWEVLASIKLLSPEVSRRIVAAGYAGVAEILQRVEAKLIQSFVLERLRR